MDGKWRDKGRWRSLVIFGFNEIKRVSTFYYILFLYFFNEIKRVGITCDSCDFIMTGCVYKKKSNSLIL